MAESIFVPFLTTIGLFLTTAVFFLFWRSLYWKKRGVRSFGEPLLGAFKNAVCLRESLGESVATQYRKYKHLRYTGTFLFLRPVLIVHDLDIIKEVVKDSTLFGDRVLYYDAENDPLSAHLFSLNGADWKAMRTKLTPVFTSGKIKYMFSTVMACISNLDVHMEKKITGKSYIVINSRELMAEMATDVILSVAFGIEGNSLDNPDAEFRKIGKEIFDPSIREFARGLALANMHSLCKALKLKATPPTVNNFFMTAIREAISYREKNNITRNDFLDLMIRLKNYGTIKEGEIIQNNTKGNYITENQIAAQAFVFFVAGFETTSSTLSFFLYEVSKRPDIQKKLHEECDAAMKECNGEITYEIVNNSLNYLEMVVKESQRLHPAVPFMVRCTTMPCPLPLTNVKLNKGQNIFIPVSALHRDPVYFPDPEKFDPERFSNENKTSIPSHAFLPFGEGPRICIGMRFAIVQVKATLLTLLSKYHFELAEGTPSTMEYDPRSFLPTPKFRLNLKVTKRR